MEYIGAFTKKAKENFKISKKLVNKELIYELVCIKKACVYANYYLKVIDKNKYLAITQACDEFLNGDFDNSIVVESIQAGGSTPTNMNVNEILAIRATQILKDKKIIVNANNDVNMSQSSNDVVPSSAIILTYKKIGFLLENLKNIVVSLDELKRKYGDVVKVGRTHMEDAVPVKFSQVFDTYLNIFNTNYKRLKMIREEFLEIPLSGTAIGTKITTPKNYSKIVHKKICQLTGLKLKLDINSAIHIQSNSQFVYLSSFFNTLSSDFIRICENLILLNSGPRTGIGEISVPEVEPGSSIMAGKVNPSICEASIMACMNVEANNNLISVANQSSHLELNIYNPIIYDKVLESLDYLIESTRVFNSRVLKGLVVNEKRCQELVENSLIFATVLNPYLGYQVVEKIIEQALSENKSLRDKITELDFMSVKNLNKILNVDNLFESLKIDLRLKEKIKTNSNYLNFCNDNGLNFF